MFRLEPKNQGNGEQPDREQPEVVYGKNGNFRRRVCNILSIGFVAAYLTACSAQGTSSNAQALYKPTVTEYTNVVLKNYSNAIEGAGGRPDIVYEALYRFNEQVGECPVLNVGGAKLTVEVIDNPNNLAQTYTERGVIELNPYNLRSVFEKQATAKYGPLSKDKMDELFNEFLLKVLIHEFGHFCFVNYNGDNNQSLEFVVRQADGSVLVFRQVRGFGFELVVKNGSLEDREFNPILSEAIAEYLVKKVTGEANEFSHESYRNLADFMKLIIEDRHWLDLNDIVAGWNDPNINFRIISLIVGKNDVNDLTLDDFLTLLKVFNEVAEGRISKEDGLYIINQLRNKNMQQ